MSAAERIERIQQEMLCETCDGTGWHPPGDRKGLACWDCIGDGKVAPAVDQAEWLLGALQATAEAFSAQANYSIGTDWRDYVVAKEAGR